MLRFAAVIIYQLRRTMGVDEFRWLVHRSMQQHCAKQSKTEVRNRINALRQQTDAPPPAPGRLSVFSRPRGTAAPRPVGQGGQRRQILVAVDMGPLALAWASKRFPDECVTPPKFDSRTHRSHTRCALRR